MNDVLNLILELAIAGVLAFWEEMRPIRILKWLYVFFQVKQVDVSLETVFIYYYFHVIRVEVVEVCAHELASRI